VASLWVWKGGYTRTCPCGMCGMQSRASQPGILASVPLSLSGQSAAFVFKQAPRKQIICTHSGVLAPCPPIPPLQPCPVAMANKLTTIKRFPAGGHRGAGGNLRGSSTVYCRPKNYSGHKLLNAKSFDFNYAENFYCQTCGCRTRTFAAFSSFFQLPVLLAALL